MQTIENHDPTRTSTVECPLPPPENSPLSLGAIVDKLSRLREIRRHIGERDKKLGQEYEQLKKEFLARVETEGLDMARGRLASASISRTVVPAIKNWEELSKYILETQQLHLLEKRVASGAFRELNNAGSVIPGVEPFTKIDINLRNLS